MKNVLSSCHVNELYQTLLALTLSVFWNWKASKKRQERKKIKT